MPEIGLEKLEARLYDLRQDINDTVAGECKRYIHSCYAVHAEDLNRNRLLLSKMVVIAGDINVAVNRYLSLLKQGVDLTECCKQFLRDCNLVKDE